jgi:hypothetical protein
MFWAPTCAATLWAVLAPSQYTATGSVSALYTGGDSSRPKLNRDNCRSSALVDVTYNYTMSNAGIMGAVVLGVLYKQDFSIPASASDGTTASSYNPYGTVTGTSPVQCTEPTSDNILQDNIPLAEMGSVSLTQLKSITVADLMDDLCDSESGVRKRRAVCLGLRNGSGSNTVARGGDGPDIDTEPPGAPSSISARAGDAMMEVTLGAPAEADAVETAQMRYVVEHRRCTPEQAGAPADAGKDGDGGAALSADAGVPDAGPEQVGACGEFSRGSARSSPVVVTGLVNGVTYQVRARAVDEFGNVGSPGGSTFGTPAKEYGFLDLYGGEVYGFSCSQDRGWTVGGVLLVGAWALSRRRRRRV